MFNLKIKYLFIILIAIYHSKSIADDAFNASYLNTSPFWVSADLPIDAGSGLPKALSAELPATGQTKFVVNGIVRSNANDASSENERLVIDGESHSLEIGIEYGLSERWSLDLQLGYIRHTGGSLDDLIDSWHNAFGLPDGDRPLFENDDLNFSFEGNGEQRQIDQSTSGVSDLRLGVGYSLNSLIEKNAAIDSLSLRSGLSLPTGDPDKLTGSDDLDWDIGLYASGQSTKWLRLGWHANLGFLHTGDDSLFGIETEQQAWFNSLGLSWALNTKLQFKAQLDSHSALFDSEIDEINQFVSQLTLGATYRSQYLGLIELYFTEDLTVNRAADFAFGLSAKFAL